jgi:hypothetical protein
LPVIRRAELTDEPPRHFLQGARASSNTGGLAMANALITARPEYRRPK